MSEVGSDSSTKFNAESVLEHAEGVMDDIERGEEAWAMLNLDTLIAYASRLMQDLEARS